MAARVRALRNRRNLTAAKLAEKCAQLGVPELTAQAIANIETGRREKTTGRRRRHVTVEELLILARALDVPPVLLLFPLGHAEQVEVLPGQTVGTWAGLKWFTGEAAFPTDTLDGVGEHPGAAGIGDMVEEGPVSMTLHLFQRHRDLVREHALLSLKTKEAKESGEDALRELVGEFGAVEARLASVRQQMRKHGLTPPTLAEDLEHVDQRSHFDLTSPEGREKAKEWMKSMAKRGYGTFTEPGEDEKE